ncbi:MAG: hypothetical protein LUC47_02410 [Clostridiales bacterium]|nr:hypothetical protein [Clostridiales bacterium]
MKNYAYFDKGILYDVCPRKHPDSLCEDREIAYQADFFVCDGKTFNLRSEKDIAALPVVAVPLLGNVTFNISYIMKIRCGGVDDKRLVPCFVEKTLDMMAAAGYWGWGDYLQVIRNYYRVGLNEQGNIFEAKYRREHLMSFTYSGDDEAEGEHLCTKYYFENQNRKFEEYKALKTAFPDLVPDTPRGYYQIRTRKTKRFLQIQSQANDYGIEINCDKNVHFCEKEQKVVHILTQYSVPDSYGYRKLLSCRCLDCSEWCQGVNSQGLACCYFRSDNV